MGLIGAGRAGNALASALAAAGHSVVAVVTRSEVARSRAAARYPGASTGSVDAVAPVLRAASLLLVAVPDDATAQVAAQLAAAGAVRPGQVIAHLGGRHGLSVLNAGAAAGAARLALHPIMTLPGDGDAVRTFAGVPFGVTADSAARVMAVRLVAELGGIIVIIEDNFRDLYHASLVLGGNFLASLVVAARDALAAAGVPDSAAVLGPLLRASLDNALASGWSAATGPVRRGDVGTVGAHRRALAAVSPASAEVYRALATFTTTELTRAGLLDPAAADDLHAALAPTPPPQTAAPLPPPAPFLSPAPPPPPSVPPKR